MKCTTVIDKNREEEILIYAHEENELCKKIKVLASEASHGELLGYGEKSIVPINAESVLCFSTENGRLYAVSEKEKLLVKERLFTLEERLGDAFIRINQSCLANVKRIKRFDASVSGTLVVIFEGGHKEYVSRRQIRAVKDRFTKTK